MYKHFIYKEIEFQKDQISKRLKYLEMMNPKTTQAFGKAMNF
jgi:hypothetical protein